MASSCPPEPLMALSHSLKSLAAAPRRSRAAAVIAAVVAPALARPKLASATRKVVARVVARERSPRRAARRGVSARTAR